MGKIKYSLNHDYFFEGSLQSFYWAGFIAADGNISKGLITIALAEKDELHLIKLKEHIESTHPIKFNNKNQYIIKRFAFYSKRIDFDLKHLFNITEKKSLTLIPPVNLSDRQKDAFICGYIDGDGCVCLTKSKEVPVLVISILGTEPILQFIRERFEEILGESFKSKINKKSNTNIFRFAITNLKARRIFIHYYRLPIYKLKRKWSKYAYDHALDFKKGHHDTVKSYKIIYPDGNTKVISNLKKFSDDNNLSHHMMYKVATGRAAHHRGYKAEHILLEY